MRLYLLFPHRIFQNKHDTIEINTYAERLDPLGTRRTGASSVPTACVQFEWEALLQYKAATRVDSNHNMENRSLRVALGGI